MKLMGRLMDDLKKQKQKRIQKTEKIIDNTLDQMTKAMYQLDLRQLTDRQMTINERLANPGNMNMITRRNLQLQLQEIETSIKLLEERVSLDEQLDIDVDEEAAKEFIAANPDAFIDCQELIDQNEALDELEKSLGLKKDD